MGEEQYHADPAPMPSLSRGTICDLIYRSPAHAWIDHPRLNPTWQPDVDKKFDVGQASHDALLCGMERVQPLDFPDWRTKAARDAREGVRSIGKLPVLVRQYEKIERMVVAARKFWKDCPDLDGFAFEHGTTEVSAFWLEDSTWCRVRWDWISNDKRLIVDYKTTENAGADWPRRSIVAHGLDIQDHWYRRGARAVIGGDPSFVFLVQEVDPPYAVQAFALEPAFQEIGKAKCDVGLRIWRECLERNEWPAYQNRIAYVEPNAWQMAEAEAMES